MKTFGVIILMYLIMINPLCAQQKRTVVSYLFNEQLPSYIEIPPDADGIYAIYPGDGIPAESSDWDRHEQSTASKGDLAIFYKDFGYASALVIMG